MASQYPKDQSRVQDGQSMRTRRDEAVQAETRAQLLGLQSAERRRRVRKHGRSHVKAYKKPWKRGTAKMAEKLKYWSRHMNRLARNLNLRSKLGGLLRKPA